MCVLELFERNVSAFPDALAVRSEDRKLTYRQLDFIAARIAAGLRAAGVAKGCLVGILLDRSPEMIAALLGVWKAGAAYIPIDLATPAERIAYILEDAHASVLITRGHLFLGTAGVRTLDLHHLCAAEARALSRAGEVAPGSIAYVIYTSGSTGKPKGTTITHGGLANTIQGVARDLQLSPPDVVLVWSTIAFDVACLEIFLPLAVGASMHLAAEDDSSRLEQVGHSRATVVFGTPTMYRLLLEEGWQGNPKMQAVIGGEVLPLQLGISLAKMLRVVWNQYGPSETAICATRARIDPDTERITIGYPLPNVHVHLLDEHFQPVSKGSSGEMYIGGAGVGLGYLNRDELNQKCFLPDPFCRGENRKLFRSGDLAMELADGSLDFIGRIDDQVKIRGYRVEVGEIEAYLRECEGVEAAVVRAVDWEAGDRRLLAFVAGDSAFTPQWKQSLRRRLPPYMIPAEFITLRSFPVTAGGKVDVQALMAMHSDAANTPDSPETDVLDPAEARLLTIWKRLLKLNSIGLDDDFFALGGHSLLAARMLRQVQQAFNLKLAHSALVENPTIRGLAAHLRGSHAEKWPALVTLQDGTTLPPLFIAHGVGGSLLTFIRLAAELGAEQPVFGLQLPSSVDDEHAQVNKLAENYLRQIRAVQPYGPYHLAGHSSGGLVAFEIACQLAEQGESVGLLALLDCDPYTAQAPHRPFHDVSSFKASLRRAIKELFSPENGIKDLVRRRYGYQKMKIKNGLANRLRRTGKLRAWLVGVEGMLAFAMRTYQVRPYPGKATLFVARDEPGHEHDLASGWTERVLGGFEIQPIPGTHQTMLAAPHVRLLAQEIRLRMARHAVTLAMSGTSR
ncbi:MAG: amino acid adenylation domain-containing protein [Acidobacteriaceae bacterium]